MQIKFGKVKHCFLLFHTNPNLANLLHGQIGPVKQIVTVSLQGTLMC